MSTRFCGCDFEAAPPHLCERHTHEARGMINSNAHEAPLVYDDDADALATPPKPPLALSPAEILRLGALTLQAEQSDAVEALLAEQKAVYDDPGTSRAALVQALLDRDRQLANMGRQIADGRAASRLLREFMRAALYAAGGKADPLMVERALQQFGVEPADLRQLRLHGSTLGPLGPREEPPA